MLFIGQTYPPWHNKTKYLYVSKNIFNFHLSLHLPHLFLLLPSSSTSTSVAAEVFACHLDTRPYPGAYVQPPTAIL